MTRADWHETALVALDSALIAETPPEAMGLDALCAWVLRDWVRTTIPINEELNYIHETTVEHVEHARGLPRKFTDDD